MLRVLLPALLGLLPLAPQDLIQNGDFSQGLASWSETASDDAREVVVTKVGGDNVLQLKRKTPGAPATAVQWNLKLKSETLYRLSVTGRGESPAAVSLRPQASGDKLFGQVLKAWAVSSGPLPASKDVATETLLFDSGLKPDSAYVQLSLAGKDPGVYYVSKVSFEEVGPARPDKKEAVVLHIGDSLTSTSYLPFGERVGAQLAGVIGKKLPGVRFRQVSVAADGESVREFLETKRYQEVVRDNYKKVDVAVVHYGGNDVNQYDVKEFARQLGTLCDNLERDYPGVRIVLRTGTYVPGNPKNVNDRYLPYWEASRDLAARRKYRLADVCAAFQAETTPRVLRGEGDMHPSAQGVTLIAETLYGALEPLLKEFAAND
jgi:lysophospholipase L1-like esterase